MNNRDERKQRTLELKILTSFCVVCLLIRAVELIQKKVDILSGKIIRIRVES